MYGLAEIKNDKIVLKTKWTSDYKDVNADIKKIIGYKFNPNDKVWEFPLSSWKGLVLFSAKYKIEVSKNLLDYIVKCNDCTKDLYRDRDIEIDNSILYSYQKDAAKRLIRNKRCGLFFPMGTGKTITSLLSLDKNKSALIICPKVVKGIWKSECERFRKDYIPIVLDEFRLPEVNEICIINYDRLPDDIIINKEIVVIADEIHYCGNSKSQRTQRVHNISKQADVFWGLTGTPVKKHPKNLWTILDVIGIEKQTYGDWNNFARLFNATKKKVKRDLYVYEFGEATEEVAENLAKTCIVIDKKEALPDLPDKVYSYFAVDIDGNIKKELDLLNEEWDKYLSENKIDEENTPFSLLSKQMKKNASLKIKAMLDFVEMYEENEEPLIVFSAHLDPLHALKDREGWDIITGDTKNKDEIVERFKKGELRGLGVSIKAGGVGISLVRACEAIFVDLEWNPADNEQAEDRLNRHGQVNKCHFTILHLDHVLERRLCKLLLKKKDYMTKAINNASKYNYKEENIDELVSSLDIYKEKEEKKE